MFLWTDDNNVAGRPIAVRQSCNWRFKRRSCDTSRWSAVELFASA